MVYEYKCTKCEETAEFEQKITDKPRKKCPSCGKFSLTRLVSRTSFILRGSGWYGDGY